MVVYLGKATPASGQGGGGSGDAVWGSITGTLSDQTDLADALSAKQDTLVSGTNIKTVNEQSLLGSGNISIDSLPNKNTASGATTPLQFWEGTESEWTNGVISGSYYNWSNINFAKYISSASAGSRKIVYGNNVYVSNAMQHVDVSSNGESWATAIGSGTWNDIAFGAGKFVVIGNNSRKLSVSTDGTNWTEYTNGLPTNGTGTNWSTIDFVKGYFMAYDGTFKKVAISSSGDSSWMSVGTLDTSSSVIKFLEWNNKILAVTDSKVYVSESFGYSWSELSTLPTTIYDMISDGTKLIATCYKKTIYSTDGETWNDGGTILGGGNSDYKTLVNCNGTFVYVCNDKGYGMSTDGINWVNISNTSITDMSKGVLYNSTTGKIISGNYTGTFNSVYTTDQTPTTESTVYSAPDVTSALTITSVEAGTIILSDNNTYAYSPSGNVITYQSIGEAYPNYVCNIDNVGLKIGTTDIANLASYSAFGGATGSVAGSAGLVPAPAATDNDKYLKGDGTWATLSALENTATGEDSLTILGTPTTIGLSLNIGSGSSVTGSGEDCCGIAIGNDSSATDYSISLGARDYNGSNTTSGSCSIAIGSGAQVTGGYANFSVALGYDALCSANSEKGTNNIAIGNAAETQNTNNSIQLGSGTNSTDNTFSVGFGLDQNNNPLNYKLLDGTTGKIPNDRINGVSGSFTSQDGKTVTVTNGVITSIV